MKPARRKHSVNTAWSLCKSRQPRRSRNPPEQRGELPAGAGAVGAVPGRAGRGGRGSQRSAIQHRRSSSPGSPVPEGGSRSCRDELSQARGWPRESAAAALAGAELLSRPSLDRLLPLCRGLPQPGPACAGTRRRSMAAPGSRGLRRGRRNAGNATTAFSLGAVLHLRPLCGASCRWAPGRAGQPEPPCCRRSCRKLTAQTLSAMQRKRHQAMTLQSSKQDFTPLPVIRNCLF